MSIQAKVEGWLRKVFQMALDEVVSFYFISPVDHSRFHPTLYFSKAVDSMAFPDYYTIVTNPIDLKQMGRKVNTYLLTAGNFDQSLQRILSDMDLMRDNAHLYNTGEANVEVRLSADAVRNFFRFLIRAALRMATQMGDKNFSGKLMDGSVFIEDFLLEQEEQDVLHFLSISHLNIAEVFDRAALIKDIGIKTVTLEVKTRIQQALVGAILKGYKPVVDGPGASKSSKASSNRRSSGANSKAPAKVKAEPAPPVLAPALAPVANVDLLEGEADPWGDDEPVTAAPIPTPTKSPASKKTAAPKAIVAAKSTATKSKTTRASTSRAAPAIKAESLSTAMDVDDAYNQDAFDEPAPVPVPAPASRKRAASNSGANSSAQPPRKFRRMASTSSVPEVDAFDAFDDPVYEEEILPAVSAAPATHVTASYEDAEDESYYFDENQVYQQSLAPLRAPPEWLEGATQVFRLITKHPWVDPQSRQIIANFMVPVVDSSPHLASLYLSIIQQPEDLGNIQRKLWEESFVDAQDFASRLFRIFQNAIDFNSQTNSDDNLYIKDLVAKCHHLRRLANWLCLEYLPLVDDRTVPQDGDLRVTLREAALQEREEILNTFRINEMPIGPTRFTECKKLLKDLERTSNREEKNRLLFFIYPVDTAVLADYAMYVRQPADLTTIKYRLDGTEPIDNQLNKLINKYSTKYESYGEYVTDLKRVFDNAKKYNVAHMDRDDTGTSKLVYEAAIFFGERLEQLLSKFTLQLADKIECWKINRLVTQREEEILRKRQEEEDEHKRQVKARMIEELKLTDEKFAMDMDFDLKRKQMEKEQQLRHQLSTQDILAVNTHKQAQQHQQASYLHSSEQSPVEGGHDAANHDLSSAIMHELDTSGAGGTTYNKPSGNEVYVSGCGLGGLIPPQFAHLGKIKLQIRQRAWDFFPVDIQGSGAPTTSTTTAGKA